MKRWDWIEKIGKTLIAEQVNIKTTVLRTFTKGIMGTRSRYDKEEYKRYMDRQVEKCVFITVFFLLFLNTFENIIVAWSLLRIIHNDCEKSG